MKKKRACIVICYFGEFPKSIESFFRSCGNNPDFNWLIFTDCKAEHIPSNVRLIETNLNDVRKLAETKIGMKLNLSAPYKLCDYKVAYGLIFEDYLEEYDFWGYGDLDVIYGNLSEFITDEIMNKYDKIYPLGHLSLLRNNEKCKKLFMQEVKNTKSYKKVFSVSTSCFFDEDAGINEKAEVLGIKIYAKFDFADIDGTYKRFRNVDKKTLKLTLPSFIYTNQLRSNCRNQIFFYYNGEILQRKYINGEYIDEKLAYIHYRRKIEYKANFADDIMLIVDDGIIGCNKSPDISSINKYNRYSLNEQYVFLKFYIGRKKRTFLLGLKDRVISTLGKSKKIRNIIRYLKK